LFKKFGSVLLIFFAVTACNVEAEDIDFTVIATSAYSGVIKSGNHVITSDAGLNALWNEIYSNTVPIPALPEINYQQSRLIILALGQKMTGGFAIQIEAVKKIESHFVVFYSIRRPSKSGMVTQAITSPFVAAIIPAGTEKVLFKQQ